jgi:hypothetical protein
VIQAAKRKARGYGKKHFKTMAYLLSGKFLVPSLSSLIPNNIKKNPIITARMLADGEKLKKNPITPLEENITPISQKTPSSFSLFILTIFILLSYYDNYIKKSQGQ